MKNKKTPCVPRSRHRRILPGMSHLVTKKCTEDLFLLTPTPEVKQVLLYALALRAARYGIVLHGFCFMTNHFHMVLTDVRGNLPGFMRDFLTNTSKALQCCLGEGRPIWDRERFSNVELLDLDAAERKIAYTVLNPTRAGLSRPENWPGLTSCGWNPGESVEVQRPGYYFSRRYSPASISIAIQPVAPSFGFQDGEQVEQSAENIRQLVEEGTQDVEEELKRQNRSFLTPQELEGQPRNRRGEHPVRTLSPRFASRDAAVLECAVAEYAEFEIEHARAAARFRGGHRKVGFPQGTYGYLLLFGVRIEKRERKAA